MRALVGVGGINHLALSVKDLERSVEFYEKGLGLRKTLVKTLGKNTWKLMRLPEGATGQSVFLQGPERVGQIELVQWNSPHLAYATPPSTPPLFVVSLPVSKEGIHTVYERVKALGAECFSEPTVNRIENYGDITMFICLDPDGYYLEIVNLPSIEEIQAFRAAQDHAARSDA